MSDEPEQTENLEKPAEEAVEAAQVKSESEGEAEQKSEEKAPSEKPEKSVSKKYKGHMVANFQNKIEIDCEKTVTGYDFNGLKGYEARSMGKDNETYVAVVCQKNLTPRIRMARVYENIVNPSIIPLVHHGVVYWPPDDAEKYVMIYRVNYSEPVLRPGDKEAMGIKDEIVIANVLQPMINVLQDFRDKDLVHGAIRPTNMFQAGGGKFERLILGDCLSVPSTYAQPSLYLPIKKSMISPIGRGLGTPAEDIYALGATLAVMIRNHNPTAGMSEEGILRYKIENGSYIAFAGSERLKANIIELLRGMLIDNESERWTIEDVLGWIDGQRLSQKQVPKEPKAQRPITFNSKKYSFSSELAMDISVNPQELLRIVESDELQQWAKRSMGDEELKERIELAVNTSKDKGMGPGYEDRLVCNISSALDSKAPLRYKGLTLFGEGVGIALTEALASKRDVNSFAEVFSYGLAMNWITTADDSCLDRTALISKYDACRTYIRQTNTGYGIERCMYHLTPDAPCLSPVVKNYYVRSAEDLIDAFEDLCDQEKMNGLFFDRHSVAYMCTRDPKSIEGYLPELNGPEPYKIILGNLKTLATIQKRSKLPDYPAIGKYIAKKLKPVYERYHDREVRAKLEDNIRRYAAQGDLVKMAGLLDNVELPEKDFANFKKAMHQYAELRAEYNKLDGALQDEASFGISTGNEIAAVVGSLLAGLAMLVSAFLIFSGYTIMGA